LSGAGHSVDLWAVKVQNVAAHKFPPEEVRSFLAEETLFHSAPPAAIDRLCNMAVVKTVPKGSALFSMGQPCDAVHFVALGSGMLVMLAPDGRERLLHRALPGEMVGAVPFFDGGRYPASFVGETDCTLLCFPRDALLHLLSSDFGLALCLVGGLVERLRLMASLVEKISFQDTTRRLWDYLVAGSSGPADRRFPRTFEPLPTRERIAVAIGTVREVVSRRLSHLADSGHIRIEGRRLFLLKPLPELGE